MNLSLAIIFTLLGVFLVFVVALVIVWLVQRKKRLPPRYIKETQQWLWLMNKRPLRIWKEKGYYKDFSWQFKWLDWNMGTALWRNTSKVSAPMLPDLGDVIVVDGRWNRQYVFVITSVQENGAIQSCYLGYVYGINK